MSETAGPRPHVYVCQPSYGECHPAAVLGAYHNPARDAAFLTKGVSVSLLGQTFNIGWCEALSMLERGEPLTHFAMLHADVQPDAFWVDTLLAEMDAHGADVISAVVPIKNQHGLTSTAVGRPGDPWRPLFRLTMRQALRLPETFSAADCGHPGKPLLVNTGCWACRMDPAWVYDFPGFTINDRVVRVPVRDESGAVTGHAWRPDVEPEDWNFSRWAHARGLKVLATRKVKVIHHGRTGYPSFTEWGEYGHDRDLDAAEAEKLTQRLDAASAKVATLPAESVPATAVVG